MTADKSTMSNEEFEKLLSQRLWRMMDELYSQNMFSFMGLDVPMPTTDDFQRWGDIAYEAARFVQAVEDGKKPA